MGVSHGAVDARPEGFSMKEVQYSQAFFVLAGLMKLQNLDIMGITSLLISFFCYL